MIVNETRVLVTGGAGFIGSHLVERLSLDGHHVTVIDNLVSGRPSNLDAANKSGLVDLHVHDVADHAAIRPLFQDVTRVIHLAGLADIVPSVESPLTYHRANVDGTASVMEAARLAGVQRVVYAASSSCYGVPDEYPTPESAPMRPQYPYALTKLLGEHIALHWGSIYSMDVVSLRLFNVYGPRARTSGAYGAVFGVFLAQKLAHETLTIVGDGDQTRDFTYVSDIVEAFVAASQRSAADVRGQAFNVGSGGTYSINSLADMIGGPRVRIPERPGEPHRTFADISKIAAALGWTPRVTFKHGVERVLDRIEDWRDAPVWTPETIREATDPWFTNLGQAKVDAG